MNHKEKVLTIQFIRPNAEFVLEGDKLEWLDQNQTKPTKSEIDAGWVAYQADQIAKAESRATSKAELLARLGITAEEAQILLS